MKCVKKEGQIKRVSDKLAQDLVAGGDWKYCPKSEWKGSK